MTPEMCIRSTHDTQEGRRVQEKTQQLRFEQIVLPHLEIPLAYLEQAPASHAVGDRTAPMLRYAVRLASDSGSLSHLS